MVPSLACMVPRTAGRWDGRYSAWRILPSDARNAADPELLRSDLGGQRRLEALRGERDGFVGHSGGGDGVAVEADSADRDGTRFRSRGNQCGGECGAEGRVNGYSGMRTRQCGRPGPGRSAGQTPLAPEVRERQTRSRKIDDSSASGQSGRGLTKAGLLGAALLAACADAPTAGTPGAPLQLSASAVDVLGSSESLGVVRDLEVGSDGSVWVLNAGDPFFVGFGPGGEFLGAHGRLGRGPREFPMPSAFVTGGWDGETWVFDVVRHAFIRISQPDAELAEIPLPSTGLPRGTVRGGMNLLTPTVRTARFGREIIVPRSGPPVEGGALALRYSLLRADLVALDPATGEARDLVSLGDVLDDPSGDFIPSEGGFPQWYRLWAPCGDDLVRVHDRVRNQLRGFDGAGTEVAPIDLPPVPPHGGQSPAVRPDSVRSQGRPSWPETSARGSSGKAGSASSTRWSRASGASHTSLPPTCPDTWICAAPIPARCGCTPSTRTPAG